MIFQDNNMDMTTLKIHYGIKLINAQSLWREGYMGDNIVVAVFDTGCDSYHNELKNNILDGHNFTKDYSDENIYCDNNGHGTHVAGIIGADGNSGKAIGVAPKSKLLILKTLNKYGKGNYKDVIKAIYYCINWRGKDNSRVRIISMSLGLQEDIKELHDAIKKAIKHNIIIVSSIRNIGFHELKKQCQYPANYNEVISVGAMDNNKKIPYFSDLNNKINVIAPGTDIYSTHLKNSYAILSGTSMAVPFVSGAIALLINKYEIKLKRQLSYLEILKIFYKHTVKCKQENFYYNVMDLNIKNI
ncbi:S8 family peptidase [Clostridium taeniosporum]|uniref:Serine protease n=1 Tax=Clostridium taeniosporum TaxID=394958 RepID=A0A1D7XI25_9CLOT|nr:S8 family peptidase [Clostridium taeniosporum]AOR22956.1 serine protease [Clostridium taeniosporum]